MLSGFIHSKGILVIGAIFSVLFEFDLFDSMVPGWWTTSRTAGFVRELKSFIGRGELPAM